MYHNKSRWMADYEASICMTCKSPFTIIMRRHHCRVCGGVYCNKCTSNFKLIHDYRVLSPSDNSYFSKHDDTSEPLRCCDSCASKLENDQSTLRQMISKANKDLNFDVDEVYSLWPFDWSMENRIKNAVKCFDELQSDPIFNKSDSIAHNILWKAKGIVLITVAKLGFMVTAQCGAGMVLRRQEDGGWSAPSAVALSGVGYGFQIGGSITDLMIVLNTVEAVNVFASGEGQVLLGTEGTLSAGPIGRSTGTSLSTNLTNVSSVYSYSHSKGIFLGVSLETCVIMSSPDINRNFYGCDYSAHELLYNRKLRPRAANALYYSLQSFLSLAVSRSVNSIPSKDKKIPVEESITESIMKRSTKVKGRVLLDEEVEEGKENSLRVLSHYIDDDDEFVVCEYETFSTLKIKQCPANTALREDKLITNSLSHVTPANTNTSPTQQVSDIALNSLPLTSKVVTSWTGMTLRSPSDTSLASLASEDSLHNRISSTCDADKEPNVTEEDDCFPPVARRTLTLNACASASAGAFASTSHFHTTRDSISSHVEGVLVDDDIDYNVFAQTVNSSNSLMMNTTAISTTTVLPTHSQYHRHGQFDRSTDTYRHDHAISVHIDYEEIGL